MALPHVEGLMVVGVPKRLLLLYVLAGFLLQCIPASTTAQPPVLQFEHLTIKDGLSDNHVWAICHDRHGFMVRTGWWIDALRGCTFRSVNCLPAARE
jgi:hypothetical protein